MHHVSVPTVCHNIILVAYAIKILNVDRRIVLVDGGLVGRISIE